MPQSKSYLLPSLEASPPARYTHHSIPSASLEDVQHLGDVDLFRRQCRHGMVLPALIRQNYRIVLPRERADLEGFMKGTEA